MRNYMSNEDMREYSDKELEYHECLREDLEKELRKNLRKEVKEEVKSEQQYEIAKNLLNTNLTIEEISKCTSLPINKIISIKKEIVL